MRVVIDDERVHQGEGLTVTLLSSKEALRYFEDWAKAIHLDIVDELWLDHDLGGEDTIRPVVDHLEEAAFNGHPYPIGVIYAHTANPVGARYITESRILNEHYTVKRVGLDMFL